MKLYSEGYNYKLYEGNMLDMLEVISPNSIDSIVTDPPYELNFMNKGWDRSGIAFQPATWEKCLSVLKPGGYLLAFGGSRTYHRIACAIEDAGFEIRDTICWLYGSGFPKSMNIGLAIDKKNGIESEIVGTRKQTGAKFKLTQELIDNGGFNRTDRNSYDIKQAQNEWQGWGTALKPAYEPVIVARKPCEGSCVDNVMNYGVGGINIDGCRIPTDEKLNISTSTTEKYGRNAFFSSKTLNNPDRDQHPLCRFPSNVILTYDETDQEEVCGGMPDTISTGGSGEASKIHNFRNVYGDYKVYDGAANLGGLGDSGSAARYFYCAKASKRDRDEGWGMLPDTKRYQQGNYSQSPVCSVCGKTFNGTNDHSLCGNHTMVYKSIEENTVRKNTHPTVKPCSLMQYLIRLVTPKGGTILDPFNGSGSTGKAAMYENYDRDAAYKYVGIELSEEYLKISDARIKYAESQIKQIKLW